VAIPTGEEQTRPVISPRRWLETPGIGAGCVFCRINGYGTLATIER
jgi:hypothetical protein